LTNEIVPLTLYLSDRVAAESSCLQTIFYSKWVQYMEHSHYESL